MKKRVFMMGCIMALGLVGCTAKEGTQPDALAIPIEENVEGTEVVEQVENNEEAPAENVETREETAEETEVSAETDEVEEISREDGERFEGVIMLEGMEETVNYEHAKNSDMGFEIDFDYENLVRISDTNRELFISAYERVDIPDNWLDIFYSDADVEANVESYNEKLSANYDLYTEEYSLDYAGICKRIYATNPKDNSPELKTIYVIPCREGSLIAIAYYTLESAEGFGRTFDQMIATIKID